MKRTFLFLGMLLVGVLVRGGVLVPERLLSASRGALENLNGLACTLALFFASSLSLENGIESEGVHMAVTRGRMLEQLALAAGRHDHADLLFMLGLFSMMDAVLGMPIAEVVAPLDLRPDVRLALTAREGPLAGWLNLAEAYEKGDWDRVEQLAHSVGAPAWQLPRIYLDSLVWAREQAPAATA